MKNLQHFLNMGGYAYYVWGAYAALFIFFIAEWVVPWRKWKKYRQNINEKKKHEPYS